MRLKSKLTIVFIFLACLMFFLGLGQKTFLHSTGFVSKVVELPENDAPIVIIHKSVNELHEGLVNVSTSSENNIVSAVGREEDVSAWIADGASNRIVADDKNVFTYAEEGQKQLPNPQGSDLWVYEYTGQRVLEFPWEVPKETGSWWHIVASDGANPAPVELTLTWKADTNTLVFWVFLAAGVLFLFLASFIFYKNLQTPTKSRRARRKSKSGKSRNKTVTNISSYSFNIFAWKNFRKLTIYVLIPILAFSGCTPAQETSLDQLISSFASSEQASHPVLLEKQFKRIFQDIASTVNTSDIAKDAEKLETRVANPALEKRVSNYKISAKITDYDKPLALGYEHVKIFAPQLGNTWPRVVLAISSLENEGSVNQAILMQQESARDQYKILFTAGLFKKIDFPNMLDSSKGSIAFPPQTQLLSEPPETIVNKYADFLTNGESSQWNNFFTTNVFSEEVFKDQNSLRNNEDVNVEIVRNFDASQIVSLSTANSGALVFANYSSNNKITPKERNFSINLPPDAAVLADVSSANGSGVNLNWSETVLIYVPPKGESTPVNILGASQGLVAASVD